MRKAPQPVLLLATVLIAALIPACSADRVAGINAVAVTSTLVKDPHYSIRVDPAEASIRVGGTVQLMATVSSEKHANKGEDLQLSWTSSHPLVVNVDSQGLLTALSVGGPVTISVSTDKNKTEAGRAVVVVTPAEPTWSTLVNADNAPTGAIFRTANAAEDNAIYAVLGGGDFQPFALWRFDLATDAWALVPTTNFPLGQYRQIVHNPLTHEILTFWDGLGQVYAVSEEGGNWHPVGADPNQSTWYEGAAFWNAVSSKLTLFGGYGGFAWKNTIWAFDPANPGWALSDQSAERPWPRFGVTQALDEGSGTFFIYGGQGFPTGNQYDGTYVLDDLWRLDLQTNTWTQIVAHDYATAPTYVAGMDIVPNQHTIYRFGGMAGVNHYALLGALERLDLTASAPAWRGVHTLGTPPSARWGAGVYYDAPRQRLLVVGGNITAEPVRLDAYALSVD